MHVPCGAFFINKEFEFEFKRVFNLSCGRVVYKIEKSKVLMEDTREKDLDLRLCKRSLEFFKIHM